MARAPRQTFRGNDRARLRKLANALDMLLGMDSRAQTKAAANLTEPTLFNSESKIGVAIQRLADRVALCLEMKS